MSDPPPHPEPDRLDPEDLDEQADTDEVDSGEDENTRRFTIRRHVRLRVDVYLQRRLKGISRSRVQKLIELGAITVNQRRVKPSTVLQKGDELDVTLPPQAVRVIESEPIPLHILHEDESFIVINKQAGLIVHPARSHLSGTLVNGLAHHFQQQQAKLGLTTIPRPTRGFRNRDRKNPTPPGNSPGSTHRRSDTADQPPPDPTAATDSTDPTDPHQVSGLSGVGAKQFRPGIVHRLDKNTTGVLVVAKSDEAHWGIARQFADRTTLKAYLAVVHGNFDSVGGVLEFPIGKHPTIREAYSVRYDRNAKPSVTLYRVREQYDGYSLVELELKTGRTHQIRIHLSYIGHPIVGDIRYGGEPIGESDLDNPPIPGANRSMITFARDKPDGESIESTALARDDLIIAHPALHAGLLSFTHPSTEKRVTFTAPLHHPMDRLVNLLRQRKVDRPVVRNGYWVDLNQSIPPGSPSD